MSHARRSAAGPTSPDGRLWVLHGLANEAALTFRWYFVVDSSPLLMIIGKGLADSERSDTVRSLGGVMEGS